MKNLLYVIAGLLFVIWGILHWGLNVIGPVHIILLLAGIIVLIRLFYDRKLLKQKE